jgi:hypothetical protein
MKQIFSVKGVCIILLICFIPGVSFSGDQVIAGLSILSPNKIQYNTIRSKQFWAKIPQNIKSRIASHEIYESKDFEILKLIFKHGMPYSLDDSANKAISNELALRKTTNVNKSIHSLRVSGFDARRISMTYDVRGGKIANESLLIFDSATRRVWMIMFALAKKKPLNPFANYNLDVERAEASAILDSVGVIR